MRQNVSWRPWVAAACIVFCATLVVAGLAGAFAARTTSISRGATPATPTPSAHISLVTRPLPTVPTLPVGFGPVFPWEGESCSMYAVQDFGKADSLLLRVDLTDPDTGDPINTVDPIGGCSGCDLEAIAIHPETGVIYAISGSGTPGGDINDGDLATLDPETGEATAIGSTGAFGENEIVAASFRRSDNTLWAFQSNVGLVSVDLETGDTTLEFPIAGVLDQFENPVHTDWEGLAWDLDGEFAYGSAGNFLYRFDPALNEVFVVCNNIAPKGIEVEALEFAFEGFLVGAHSLVEPPELVLIDVPSDDGDFGAGACMTVSIEEPSGDVALDDLESLAFVPCPGVDDEDEDEDEDDDGETPDDEDEDGDDDEDGEDGDDENG